MVSDLRFAFRTLLRNRGITAVAVLALALGIGANTAIFSVLNAALLRPLPFRDPGRLVWVWMSNPSRNLPQSFMAYWMFDEWRRTVASFESASAYEPGSANLIHGSEPERVTLVRVNASFFPMLGVHPVLGRAFSEEEDRPGAAPVVLLDHALWERRFGSDRTIPGKSILLDSQPYTVLGVLPPDFQIVRKTDLYMPIARAPVRGQGGWTVGAYARLKPGVSRESAQREMDACYARIHNELPQTRGWLPRVWWMRDFMVRDVRLTLWVLLGAVALVLLIACANVANLLLARSGARRREIAMRIALGAGRVRLLRQLLLESMLLGLAGGALGLALAAGGVRLFKLLGPAQFPMLAQTTIDWPVLAFTLLASLFTGVLFGLAPALAGMRTQVYENLKEGGRSGESIRRNRGRSALVVFEMALALLLMAGASLMIRSLVQLRNANPGFNPEGVLTASITLPRAEYSTPELRIRFYTQLLERLRALPGVQSAGMTSSLPFGGSNSGMGMLIEGQPPPRPGELPIFFQRSVDPSYFHAMRIRLLRGRVFDDRDTGQSRVAVINDVLAKRHWPNQDPVGKRFGNGRDWITVVGVVPGVRHMSLAQEPEPEFYEPHRQNPAGAMHLVLRTAGNDPLRFAPIVRRVALELDKNLPVSRVGSMQQSIETSTASRRFSVILLGIFAGVALLLAAVGIYGVISFSVTRRTREIGVRLALGAQPRDVLLMVVAQAMALAVAGVLIGIAGGFALARVIRSLLYGISPTDPLALGGASLVLLAVAAVASYLPARRAARVDPVVALRYE